MVFYFYLSTGICHYLIIRQHVINALSFCQSFWRRLLWQCWRLSVCFQVLTTQLPQLTPWHQLSRELSPFNLSLLTIYVISSAYFKCLLWFLLFLTLFYRDIDGVSRNSPFTPRRLQYSMQEAVVRLVKDSDQNRNTDILII